MKIVCAFGKVIQWGEWYRKSGNGSWNQQSRNRAKNWATLLNELKTTRYDFQCTVNEKRMQQARNTERKWNIFSGIRRSFDDWVLSEKINGLGKKNMRSRYSSFGSCCYQYLLRCFCGFSTTYDILSIKMFSDFIVNYSFIEFLHMHLRRKSFLINRYRFFIAFILIEYWWNSKFQFDHTNRDACYGWFRTECIQIKYLGKMTISQEIEYQ